MKILFISHYYAPEGNAPASRVSSMCRRWVEAGHEVTVLTGVPNVPNGVAYEGYKNGWCHEELMQGVKVVRVWSYLAPNQGSLRRILNYLSFCLSAIWRAWRLPDCDLVIATSPQFFCGWAGVWAARLKRRPFLLEIRDIWPESLEAVGALGSKGRLRNAAMRYLAWLELRMYRAARHIVTVGEGYRGKLIERGVEPSAISVITNGVEQSLFTPRTANSRLRAQAGAGEADFLVGYLGTVGMAHGLEVVIEAARSARRDKIAGLKFVVVGSGARLDELQSQLTEEDAQNLCLLGQRPKQEIPDLLASMDACLVHLRDNETFRSVLPSKIFESAAMGKPILLGVRGEAERLVEELGCGISFTPECASELLEAAQLLMNSPGKVRTLGRQGQAAVKAGYGLDQLAARYLGILEERLLGRVASSKVPEATPSTEEIREAVAAGESDLRRAG